MTERTGYRGEMARVGTFLNGRRFLASTLVDQSAMTQSPSMPQGWTIVGSVTAGSFVVHALVTSDPSPSTTAIYAVISSTSATRTSQTRPDALPWPHAFAADPTAADLKQQRVAKNAAAIALLDHWLAESASGYDEQEAREFDAIRKALDTDRMSSRKLFP